MARIEPITPVGRTTLEAFLSRPGLPEGTLSFGEVQGFLFALAAAPDFVKPSEWLPMIFGDGEPGFETMEEGQEVMGLVLALYNEKLDEVREEGLRMPEGCEFRDDLLANLEPDAPVAQWSRRFRTGHLWMEGPPGPAVAKARPGRNKRCPCGSGRKYKKCRGAKVR